MIKNRCRENGNDIYCHPVHTVESRFFEPPRETRIGLKNRVVREIGGKINVRMSGGKTTSSSKNQELRKIEYSKLLEHERNY
jgi:hypothetical protein